MNFFSQKATNKIFIIYSFIIYPFIVQNFEKSLQPIQSYKDVPFLGQKWHICSEHFFWQKPLISVSSNYWFFSLCKTFLKFLEQIQSYEDVPFFDSKWSFCTKQNFEKKFLILFSSTCLLVPFIVRNFKKLLQWIQSYEYVPFLGPKLPIYPNENFFRKHVHKPCSFHSRLSTCQKSKSDINLLVKY